MKRKYILAAAALAVLCVGTVAYSMKQNTELPSDAPNSSSAPSSIASSEPESGSTSVTDNRDIAKAENFVTYQVFKEETTTGTETHPEDQVNVSDDKVEAAHNQAVEGFITRYMEETGATREEAEAWWQNHQNEANAAREEAEQKREELADLRQQELDNYNAARDEWYRENFGMSLEAWLKLSPAEKSEVVLSHPEVDNSTNPESSWDWQYQ